MRQNRRIIRKCRQNGVIKHENTPTRIVLLHSRARGRFRHHCQRPRSDRRVHGVGTSQKFATLLDIPHGAKSVDSANRRVARRYSLDHLYHRMVYARRRLSVREMNTADMASLLMAKAKAFDDARNAEAFDTAMKRVEMLREAKAQDIARRDRAEWECFMHFACQTAFLKKQAG